MHADTTMLHSSAVLPNLALDISHQGLIFRASNPIFSASFGVDTLQIVMTGSHTRWVLLEYRRQCCLDTKVATDSFHHTDALAGVAQFITCSEGLDMQCYTCSYRLWNRNMWQKLPMCIVRGQEIVEALLCTIYQDDAKVIGFLSLLNGSVC